jgi:hypothetical protein
MPAPLALVTTRSSGIARPDDGADPNLTKWNKDPNNPIYIQVLLIDCSLHSLYSLYPIYIQDASHAHISQGFAGPSNLFKVGDTINMVMQLGNDIARFESADATLHNWTVADPKWFVSGGKSGHGSTGIMFFKLPGTGEGTKEGTEPDAGAGAGANAGAVSLHNSDTPTLTHMLSGIWPNNNPNYLVGCPWVVMGHYDSDSGNFTNTTSAQPLDAGTTVIWSTGR